MHGNKALETAAYASMWFDTSHIRWRLDARNSIRFPFGGTQRTYSCYVTLQPRVRNARCRAILGKEQEPERKYSATASFVCSQCKCGICGGHFIKSVVPLFRSPQLLMAISLLSSDATNTLHMDAVNSNAFAACKLYRSRENWNTSQEKYTEIHSFMHIMMLVRALASSRHISCKADDSRSSV